MTEKDKPLQLNLKEILRNRMSPRLNSLVPSFLITGLERLIHQDELNRLLREGFPKRGSDFADFLINELDIKLNIVGAENIPASGRFVFASNHPLGGLDGVALIGVLGKMYGDENVRFLVNDMLMNVEPLSDVFLPINKYGSQGREAASVINDTYASDKQILVFPAGLVSRRGKGGEVRDLEWQKAFVIKAIQNNRDIIPVKFEGLNSNRFYNTARWRKRLGLKVNIEQALLPSELCNSAGNSFTIKFGKPIPWQRLAKHEGKPKEIAEAVKKIVYDL